MISMQYILLFVAYLVGSIPFSIIVGKVFKGIDVRDYGSGNPGTTNAFRVLGKKLGLLVFLLDVFKGGFMILMFRTGVFPIGDIHILVYGLMSSIGHIYPIFIKFKGGKAVATSVGIFLFYAPILGLIGLAGYFITLKISRYVSISSCVGAASLWVVGLFIFFFGPTEGPWVNLIGLRGELAMPIITTLGTGLIIFRHRGNFLNIKRGTEPKTNFMQKNKVDNSIK